TLYAAVEGRGPFDRAGGSAAIVASIATEPAPRAPSAGSLAPVIDMLLRADPAERPDAAATGRMLTQAWKAARVAERVTLGGLMAANAAGVDGAGDALGAGPAAGRGQGGSEFTTATQVVTVPGDPGSLGAAGSGSRPESGPGSVSVLGTTGLSEAEDELAELDAAAEATGPGFPARAEASAATGVVPDLMATPNFADLKMPALGSATELGPNQADLVIGGTAGSSDAGNGDGQKPTTPRKAG